MSGNWSDGSLSDGSWSGVLLEIDEEDKEEPLPIFLTISVLLLTGVAVVSLCTYMYPREAYCENKKKEDRRRV